MRFILSLLALAVALTGAVAKQSGPVPADVLFRDYRYNQMVISPDGQTLASVFVHEEGRNVSWNVLATYDVAKRQPRLLLNQRGMGIARIWWVGDRRLLVRYWTRQGPGLLACNADGSETVILHQSGSTNPGGLKLVGRDVILRDASVVHALPDDPAHVLVARAHYTESAEKWLDREFRGVDSSPGVFRLNTYTGEFTTVVKDPELAVHWMADPSGRVRVAVSLVREDFDEKLKPRDETRFPARRIYWIGDDGAAIRLSGVRADWDDNFVPIGVEAGGRSFLFVSRQGGDRAAVWRYNRDADAVTGPVAADERVEVEDAYALPLDGAPVSVVFAPGLERIQYLDADLAAMQPGLDDALAGFTNRFSSWDRKKERLLLNSASVREPGRYYLFDRTAGTLEAVFYRCAGLNDWTLASTEPISFPARDGVRLDGYLTRPPGADPRKPLPLFVLVHGGPWTIRDRWEFNPEVQFLATRGYAVLQVNFRGSGGYGRSFAELSRHEFGQKMQDDLTDAAEWALSSGIAARGRLGIAGASYGGYAVLRALTREPDLFQVGVAFFGVSDLVRQIADYGEKRSYQLAHAYWKAWVGDPTSDRSRLEAISPINRVEQIKAPLFVVYGQRDPLISFGQSADLVRSLRKHRKTFVRYAPAREGHGLEDEDTRIKIYEALDEFLPRHFPAR